MGNYRATDLSVYRVWFIGLSGAGWLTAVYRLIGSSGCLGLSAYRLIGPFSAFAFKLFMGFLLFLGLGGGCCVLRASAALRILDGLDMRS